MLGRGKNEPVPAETRLKGKGFAAGNVSISRMPEGRRVEIILIACDTGETIFKAAYRTRLNTDFAAFEDAKTRVNDYLVEEKLVLHDELTTNAQLPSVTSHLRGSRW